MTEKNYELLAQHLLTSRPSQKLRPEAFSQWLRDVRAVEDALSIDNPRFDCYKFRQACGYYENEGDEQKKEQQYAF